MKRAILTGLLGAVVCVSGWAQAEELVLVENGVVKAPIVVFEGAPPRTRQAADELAEYIEKTAGAKPAVIEGRPEPIPEHAIWVGHQPLLNELFPNLDFDFQHPEEILIAANENHLVIAGRDRWDPDHLRVQRGRSTVTGVQQEYGTVNAVYTFLQDWLDVRWLWPGELGEDIVEQSTLAFEPFTHRYHPQIRHRSGVLYLSRLGGRSGQSHEWCRLQRIQLDSLHVEPSSHGFTDWWERFHEPHPEYFAMQPDGTRSGWPSPRGVKVCQSNPAVWKQWIADVEAALAEDPNLVCFDAGPNDGWSSGHCVCESCLAWDHPEGEPRMFNWQGVSQQYVALSDRDATFYNHLARLLKQRFPDRKLYVRGSAYGHTRPAPIEAVPAESVLITSVANFLLWPDRVDRGSSRGTTHREQFDAWGKVAPALGWRPNVSGGVRHAFPDVKLRHVMDEFRFVAERNCISLTFDTFLEFWATQGPMYYLMAHLAWNPRQDGEALLQDYYARGFGKASDTIGEYWALLETMSERHNVGDDYGVLYNPEFFAKASALLDRAASQVADEPKRYEERVEFVRAGLDYSRMYVNLLAAMDRFRKSGEQDQAAADKARTIWTEFRRIDSEHPYALHWERIRPLRSVMQKLHPDGRSGDPSVD